MSTCGSHPACTHADPSLRRGDPLHKGESCRHTVRCVKVTKKSQAQRKAMPTLTDRFFRGLSKKKKRVQGVDARSTVKAKATGPLSWVTLLGFFLALSLFIISIALGDGMSLIATLLLSLLSTLVGIGNKWQLGLSSGPQATVEPPPGDVVIRYPNGSFLVVKCDESVARELYFAPEEIKYNIKSPEVYRLISLIGTLMLMLGVISLANARLQLQFAWAGAYILINAAQWTAAALPARSHWDLSCYTVTEEGLDTGPANTNFTEALWKAIMLTKSTGWVKLGSAAPRTDTWSEWLREAETKSRSVMASTGHLKDPNRHWKGGNPEKSTIWRDGSSWDAKGAWDKHNRCEKESKNTLTAVRRMETV